jgi:hypothetical protein
VFLLAMRGSMTARGSKQHLAKLLNVGLLK